MVDLPTLIAVGISAKAAAGVLLIYAWLTNRYTPSLAPFAIAFLVASAVTALIVSQQRIGEVCLIDITDALLIAAYALLWMGARSFNTAPLWGLRVRPRLMHDGGSRTIFDAIQRHRGEANAAARRFERLPTNEQNNLLVFLRSL